MSKKAAEHHTKASEHHTRPRSTIAKPPNTTERAIMRRLRTTHTPRADMPRMPARMLRRPERRMPKSTGRSDWKRGGALDRPAPRRVRNF
jgi:hypothetical protein